LIPLALFVLAALALLVLAFLFPRWSRRPQGGLDHAEGKADDHVRHSDHASEHVAHKPLEAGRKVADTAADAGRRARREVD
jgi:hypothetical protein